MIAANSGDDTGEQRQMIPGFEENERIPQEKQSVLPVPAFFQLVDYGTLQVYNNLEIDVFLKKRDLTGKNTVGTNLLPKT